MAKIPAKPFDNIFQGSTHDVLLFIGVQTAVSVGAFAYDVACKPAPCVAMVTCREGCNVSNTQVRRRKLEYERSTHRKHLNFEAIFSFCNHYIRSPFCP